MLVGASDGADADAVENGDAMETAAYCVALLTVVAVPPVVLVWLLIHPFICWWRNVGPLVTYLVVGATVVLLMAAIYWQREWLLKVRFGVDPLMVVAAVLLYVMAILIGIERSRRLGLSDLLGVSEIRGSGSLVTGGIYARVRNPRYLEGGLAVLGGAIFSGYLAVYVLFAVYIPLIYLVVRCEERELRDRFGSAYEEYCRKVPRFLPRVRGWSPFGGGR